MYKMKYKFRNYIALTVIAAAVLIVCCLTQNSSQLAERRGRNESCGTPSDSADRVEICAKPVMDILEGNLQKWPRSLEDIDGLCQEIHGAERCIRDEGRRCAQGLHKTIISTVANSIQRARKRECAKNIHPSVLHMINCIEKHTKDTKKLIGSAVHKLRFVETQMKDLDKKTNGVCCVVRSLEGEVKTLFDQICPDDTALMVRLYRGVLDDVRELICRSTKCSDELFRGYQAPRQSNFDHSKLIATIIRVVFSLDG